MRSSISSAMAWVWRSLDPLVMRKKSVKPASTASSSRIRVSSAFLSSQASAAAKTMRRVSVVAIRSGWVSLVVSMVSLRPIEAVGANVFRYCGREHGLLFGALCQRGANLCSGNVLIQIGEQKQRCSSSRSPGQGIPSKSGLVVLRHVPNPGGKRPIDLFEREARPAADNKITKKQKFGRSMPLSEREE